MKTTTWVSPAADDGIACYSDKAAAIAGRGKATTPIWPHPTNRQPNGVVTTDSVRPWIGLLGSREGVLGLRRHGINGHGVISWRNPPPPGGMVECDGLWMVCGRLVNAVLLGRLSGVNALHLHEFCGGPEARCCSRTSRSCAAFGFNIRIRPFPFWTPQKVNVGEYDSDLTLPGLWHSSSGAVLVPIRLHLIHH